ncbi:hypothetical protein [Blastococcus saxobsidens]|uniref:Uncharacterized protein n=1 Tax=Blastococcus saxobsidens TaxID=138336 RepID=A0A4Q7Y648_9ACTN|nr:hypothetical protein [Blastococcus saxobsidens]RZU31581.1 hypothetical protein BKA19_1252 [Blastococcus saxobsidens]
MAAWRGSQALVLLALLLVVVGTARYGLEVWQDSGSFVLALFGVPALCAVGALWAERAGRSLLATTVVAALGLLSLVWSLLTGLGLGLLFLPSSLLLLGAAAVSWTDRRRNTPRPAGA